MEITALEAPLRLTDIDLLSQLPAEDLAQIELNSLVREKRKGDVIYKEEDPAGSIYFLRSGRVKISIQSDDGREVIKSIVRAGDIFGELSLAGEESRHECAVAMTSDTVVWSMDAKVLRELMRRYPEFSIRVTTLLGNRLRSIQRRWEALTFKDARTRIIEFLKENASIYGKSVGLEVLFQHSLTHQNIADLTDTSRQTVTTVLNELRKDDLIHIYKRSILVRDLESLK